MKKYDAVVFIGRFQPFHNAHLEIVKTAYDYTDDVILIRGSQFKPVTYKNPFQTDDFHYESCDFDDAIVDSIKDIIGQISQNSEEQRQKSFSIIPVRDNPDDNVWAQNVSQKVDEATLFSKNVALIGCKKDDTSFYLDMFPQWEFIELQLKHNLSATQIRELYFVENPNLDFLKAVVPRPVFNFLDNMKNTYWHQHVINERRCEEKYKQSYINLPFPPTFITVDPVVFCSGHVLMIRRGAYPGKGLLALPGGFLDANTDPSLEYAMFRELKEETGLTPENFVIKSTRYFDSPKRSTRGRTVTHAFNIVLSDKTPPEVQGASDATVALWIPFEHLKTQDCFEDHYDIIQSFL
jgi:bifunctional NMN adenylyltransferase/nudix hydrolase